MAQELLLAGATLSLRDETGSTAMDWARGYCNENEDFDCAARQVRKRQIVKLLRAHMSKRGEREEAAQFTADAVDCPAEHADIRQSVSCSLESAPARRGSSRAPPHARYRLRGSGAS